MQNKQAQLSKFVPGRLTEARESRGLTLKELGEKIGVSHQSISKYENGKAMPSIHTLDHISEVLSLPTYFFFKPINDSNHNEVVFFRSRAAATVKSKKIHSNRLKWLKEIHTYLEEILEFPKIDIPKINTSETYIPLDFNDIDEIADQVRKHWNLGVGPISNVLLLLEKKGVIIARASFSDYKIDACSVWEKGQRPYIFLGSDKTASRSRFDVAHELGHLVLHSNLKLSEFNKKENYKLIEKEADRFASAFLLPISSFGSEIISSSLEHLINLKKRWKVSINAMAYRAMQLNIFSEFQYINIRQKLSKNGWLKDEPLDKEFEFEEPSALKQAMELIIEHNVKTKSDIVYEIGLPREEIEILSNLEPGFLLEEDKSNGKIFSFRIKKADTPF